MWHTRSPDLRIEPFRQARRALQGTRFSSGPSLTTRESSRMGCPHLFALPVDRELAAAVQLPAALIVFGAEWLFFAVADGADAVGSHSGGGKRFFDCVSPVFAQRQVIFGRAAFVAIAADDHLNVGVGDEPSGVLG